MASLCRSASMARVRFAAIRSKSILPKPSPSGRNRLFSFSRSVSVMRDTESLMPLHSAIASARLRSNLATGSSCWSWLSQEFGVSR
ncbi:hypothetical protein QJS10_CPA02g01131 [Acorus calamus]|uniref:Protein NUCLEAR FUSION DEFECTIVE 6, chloroplastic/mitochondrial-like n=1 Tax=Acorus calamus TaxID=4465 RepID=A0AAV9FD56_ACOCL|nr:hypothetical protein QJS10_CPA02g01131 [Acorus calamus]